MIYDLISAFIFEAIIVYKQDLQDLNSDGQTMSND